MKPSIVVFDVNETLSDTSPLGEKFVEVGAPAHLAKLWFASVLRDGFALAASGDSAAFADVGAEALRGIFSDVPLKEDPNAAVEHVMAGLAGLSLHTDAVDGICALQTAGYRLATLSNGSTSVAERLFDDAGIRDRFDLLLSVDDATMWKPGRAAYQYAATVCGVSTDQMLLVAVHPWDIHGASRAGLTTAWLNRTSEPYPGHFHAPDITVTSLPELVPALH